MHLDIITPDRKVFEGEAKEVYLPGVDGSFELLDHHAAMVSALTRGEVRVTSSAGNKSFQIHGGVVEVSNNNVTVLAEGITE